MDTKLFFLSLFTLIYFFGGQWWYSTKIADCCLSELPKVTAEIVPTSPVSFNRQDSKPILNDNFQEFRAAEILSGKKEDNILQITGYYYSNETAPEGFDNMGLARAAALREILKGAVPEDRIDILSKQLEESEKTADKSVDGASFHWMEKLKEDETTIVEIDNEITIYFPFNSSEKNSNKKVDEYLANLVSRLQQTAEKVSITGHTDNKGTPERNIKLGMQRALSIQNILITGGISENRISVDSKGERQPAASNDTDNGRHRNRRTVLKLIK